MSEKKVLLELRGVKTFFPVRGGFFNKVRDHVQAVNDVDLDIYKGETLGLVGESGCGKTTLGKSIIQLVKATDGTMMYDFGPQHGGKKDLRHLNREDEPGPASPHPDRFSGPLFLPEPLFYNLSIFGRPSQAFRGSQQDESACTHCRHPGGGEHAPGVHGSLSP